ncbi:hypothetical protein PV08_05555 [Exophiala spinifera]|uniref:DUF6604 domain-containing protein n=1 Tax=Exophiala spinifera TaxID=91928 RepID=A0A0D2BWA9_9EURO|nr:uncharacterized protein PV08_05555 [Exophiala spinifera]KIW15509.1 hypothetical protein PV08_05555 [Exophiala spinifera]
MLLNPSHKITFSGLPPDVLDAYVRYKKGSRALVAWLIQYSPTPNRRVKTLPIKELEALAKTAAKSLRSVPDMVHFYFRETISSRKRLSKYFRAQVDEAAVDVDTINHEHFTTSLAQIYSDLCECCGRNDHKVRNQKKNAATALEGPKNTYIGLDVEHIDETEVEPGQNALSSCPECTAVTPTNCDGKNSEVHFADDELGLFLQVNEAIQRIRDISSSAERCWTLAANGHFSFPVAAFVTNVAFSMLRQVGIELLEHDEELSLSGLHQMCCKRSGNEIANGENFGGAGHVLLDELQKLEQSVLHFREGHRKLLIPSCAACVQKPAEYIQPPADGSGTTARPQFVEAIVDNIVHLVARTAAPPNIIRNSTPVYADVGYLITRTDDENAQSWSAILGLSLLTKGYRSYIESLSSANEISRCRLAALRLAQQASSQVSRVLNDKTCFPCRCTQTLAYHLQNLEADLSSYAKYKCWDIYFQSPWVAGNQMLEILDLCHYYGMRLFNYRHYVGAVLHSYNALTQLERLEKIPILESLCDQFSGVFFPGGTRPKGSFRACWSRYVGARLKFKKGHKNRNSNDAWCMAIPAHAARRAAGLGAHGDSSDASSKIDCLLFKVKQHDYHVGEDVWDSLNGGGALVESNNNNNNNNNNTHYKKGHAGARKGRSGTSSGSSIASTAVSSQRRGSSSSLESSRLLDLAEAAHKSFATATTDSGTNAAFTLPLARLNMFAVFEKCLQVVSTLSDGTHAGQDEKGINCICFASAILTGGDRIVDGRKLGRFETWKKDEKECVTQAGKVILKTFGNVKTSDHDHDHDNGRKNDREQWLWSV